MLHLTEPSMDESDSKDYLKPLDSSGTENEPSLSMLGAGSGSDVTSYINLGALGDMSDTLNVSEADDNTDHQIKVEGVLSNTGTNILQENLVLVETSKGLVLSVTNLDGISFSSSFITAGADNQGQTVQSSSMPATIPVFSTLLGGSNDSQVTMYGTVGEGNVLMPANIFQDADSTTELQTTVTVADSNTSPELQKRKGMGGWPKGRKRKPVPEVSVPKKPMTGYVIFATRRRKEIKKTYPELTFPVVTRQMGQEWSHMSDDEKKRYLMLAEKDKQRYIDEMQEFQKTVQFQTYLKNKRQHSDIDTCLADDGKGLIDLEDDEEMDELFCKVCNQYFISAHNKKEHMFGRQHLQNITNEILQTEQMMLATEEAENAAIAESLKPTVTEHAPKDTLLDIKEFIQEFMKKNTDLDKELSLLKKTHEAFFDLHDAMSKQMKELEELESKLEQDLGSLKAYGASLSAQVDALKMVPTLFGVINF